MARRIVVHSAFWTPLARWAPRCDKRWNCDQCHVRVAERSYLMEGYPGWDLKKITCGDCRRDRQRAARAEGAHSDG